VNIGLRRAFLKVPANDEEIKFRHGPASGFARLLERSVDSVQGTMALVSISVGRCNFVGDAGLLTQPSTAIFSLGLDMSDRLVSKEVRLDMTADVLSKKMCPSSQKVNKTMLLFGMISLMT
jgi:hypothetical protein